MATLKEFYQNLTQTYRKSSHREIYEQIADDHSTTPQRVYRLAHGARPKNREEAYVIQELITRGIICP